MIKFNGLTCLKLLVLLIQYTLFQPITQFYMYLPNHLSLFFKPRYCRRVVNRTLLMMLLAGARLLSATAQVIPPAGSLLNYTQIMFEYPALPGAEVYVIQVAEYAADGNFKQPVVEQRDSTTATLIAGLSFGKKYQWRYAGILNGKKDKWNGPFEFSILDNEPVKTNLWQLHVIKNNALQNTGGLIIPDFLRAAFDRNGNCVWFLPQVGASPNTRRSLRDLRCTADGNFSFISEVNGAIGAFVCDINGKLLWQAPNAGGMPCQGTEYYHHDFKLLPNGNYMVLSMKQKCDTTQMQQVLSRGEYGTILEYNKKGEIVWQWSSEKNLADTDVAVAKEEEAKIAKPGKPGLKETEKNRATEGAHLNAFDTDSSGQYVYAGFRNISRVIKIDKKTGQIVRSWGRLMPSGQAKEGNQFFYTQHDVNLLSNGNLAVFNNNNFGLTRRAAGAVIFNQPAGDTSRIVWEYNYPGDSSAQSGYNRGGNVDELTNNAYLVCNGMGGKIFEITTDKQITWDADIEHKNTGGIQPVGGLPLYRAHYTSSLYPCYFTINVTNTATGTLLKINNEGTEPDAYTVAGLLTTATIQPGKSATVTLPTGKQEVTVTSVRNPDLTRSATWVTGKK